MCSSTVAASTARASQRIGRGVWVGAGDRQQFDPVEPDLAIGVAEQQSITLEVE